MHQGTYSSLTLPSSGRVRDFHPIVNAHAEHTKKPPGARPDGLFFCDSASAERVLLGALLCLVQGYGNRVSVEDDGRVPLAHVPHGVEEGKELSKNKLLKIQ